MIHRTTTPKISMHLRHYSRFLGNRAGDRVRSHWAQLKQDEGIAEADTQLLIVPTRTGLGVAGRHDAGHRLRREYSRRDVTRGQ
jgi:hypothetical protein